MRHLLPLLILIALMPATAGAQAPGKKIQCWTDDKGQRMCGDRVPPEYAGQKRDILKDGRVVETVKAAKTPEEIAEEKRKKQADEEARKAAAYDRALLETYRNAKDIEAMRNERVAMVDMRLAAAEKNAGDTDRSLEGLRGRAAALEKDGKPVDERLAKQIKEFERAQRQNAKAIVRYKKEREEVLSKFNYDLERYHALRGTTPPAAAPAPPAATPAPGATPAAKQKPG